MGVPITLVPGEWYLLLYCPNCYCGHIIVDSDKGQLDAQGSSRCSHCQGLMPHNLKTTIRYRLPLDYTPGYDPTKSLASS